MGGSFRRVIKPAFSSAPSSRSKFGAGRANRFTPQAKGMSDSGNHSVGGTMNDPGTNFWQRKSWAEKAGEKKVEKRRGGALDKMLDRLFVGDRRRKEPQINSDRGMLSGKSVGRKTVLPDAFWDVGLKVSSRLQPDEIKYNSRKNVFLLGEGIELDRFNLPKEIIKAMERSRVGRKKSGLRSISARERAAIKSVFRQGGTRLRKANVDLHSSSVKRSREKSSLRKTTIGELLGRK